MRFGAEPKKLAFLGGLVLVGGIVFYMNVLSGPDTSPPATHKIAVTPASPLIPDVSVAAGGPVRRAKRSSEEFRPSMKRKPDEVVDRTKIDPTLRTDLLAKVQAVDPEGGSRNLFQFAQPPAPPLPPTPKVVPLTPQQLAQKKAAEQAAPKPPGGPPPPPPITFKYYGYSTLRGEARKRAFLLDGDDILVASEGDIVKKRYRVVKIGVNSVLMEDMDSKTQQALPLQEETLG